MSQTAPTPAPGKNPPMVTIDMLPKDAKQLHDLKPGDNVRVVLTGEVVEASEREPSTGFPIDFAGTLRIEVSKTEVSKRTDYSELLDEDD